MMKKEIGSKIAHQLGLRNHDLVLAALTILMILIIFVYGGLVYGRVNQSTTREFNSSEEPPNSRSEGIHYAFGVGEYLIQEERGNEKSPSGGLTKTLIMVQDTVSRVCYIGSNFSSNNISFTPLGIFKVTAYTAGYESTGKTPGDPYYGITASGNKVVENLTIAADWELLPVGTWVFIEDVGYRLVQDKGGSIKGNCLDLYIAELDDALEWGEQNKQVWIVETSKKQ